MADLIKKIKIKKQDGTFTDYIPIGAEASNVSMNNGKSVQSIIGDVDVDRDGSIAEQLDKHKDYDSSIKTLKADKTVGYVYFYLEDMEDGTYVVKNISKEYPVSFLCYPKLIKDKTDKTYNNYDHIMLHNNDILQLFKVGDNINGDTRIRHIPTNDSKITCFSIKEINDEESDETSYSWNRDYIGLTEKNYSTSRYDTYNCHYLNNKLVNVGAEEDDNFKVNIIKSKNLYNPSYRANDGTIKSTGGTGTESNGVFTLVASENDSYFWQVATENVSYIDGKGELYEFKKDTYTISLSNTAFNNNFITYYDANKVSLGFNVFKNSTFTINKSDKTGAKYFTIRFGIYPASSGTTYSTTIQLEEGKKATTYEPYVTSSIYVDNEKFTETIGVGSSVDNNYRVNVLHSRNLFDGKAIYFANATETNITNGKRISNVDSGAAFVLYLIKNVSNDEGKIFTLKASFTSGRIGIGLCDESGANRIFGQYIDTGNTSISYTIPSLTTSKYLAVWLYGSVGLGTATNDYTNIMINEGSTALSYEPYIPSSIYVDNEKFTETIGVGTSVNSANRVNVLHSSNLWHYNTTKTTNGVTSTYENSTITLNGTAIGSGFNVPTNLAMLHLNAGNYALKLTEISGTKPSGQSLIIRNVTSGTNLVDTDFSTTNTYTFTLSSNADIAVRVGFWNNNVFDNYKFGVQLQEGSKTDAYKPYIAPSIVVDGEEIYTKGQNEIIESGSNANGNYIKFADGTLICTIIKTINVAINTAWGSLYIGDTDTKYTYPIAFVGNDPVVNYSITGYNSAFVISWRQSSNKLVETDVFALVRGNTASAQDYVLNITAIGRWK